MIVNARAASRVSVTLAVTTLAVTGLVACGGGGKSSSSPAPSGGQNGQASEGGPGTGGQSPRYGGTLVVALPGDPSPLNPAITPSGITHPVTGQIFDGLVRLYGADFHPRPDLARSWDISKDGRTYTFHLQQGVRWHDGKPFSSADVKYTYENILLKLGARTRALKPVIRRIDTPDENTVVFGLAYRYPPFLKWLDEDNGAILPKHIYQGTDPLKNPANAKPVGTGPFMFQSAIKGNRITLVRNPHYFEKGRPYLDRIDFRIIPPPQAVQAFRAGEIGLMVFPTPPDLKVLKSVDGVTVTQSGKQGFARVIRMIPNLRRKPFGDVRVRRAIASAIDRPFIAKAAYGGTFTPATGPISHDFRPWYSSDVMKFPHDPSKAKALLDQAGLKPGKDGVRLRTSLIFDPAFAPTAALLKQELGQVGIALKLQLLDFNGWVTKLYIQKDFDLGYSQITDPADPDIGSRGLYTCSNIAPVPFSNGSSYCNPKVDKLYARAAREPDMSKRVALYAQIQRILVRDQPQFFLVDAIGPWAWSAKYAGFDQAGAKSPYYFGHTAFSTSGSATPTG